MKQVMKYRGQKVLILGFAKSGFAVAKIMLELGATVVVNDQADLTNDPNAQALQEQGVVVISGGHPQDLLDASFSYVIKNPGIPYTNVVVEQAQKLKIPILTEPEIAFEISEAPIVGITGSNGKTTTTLLTAAMLEASGQYEHVYAVGNIGVPSSEIAAKATKNDLLVAELSSFQLMGMPEFHPIVAAIVDIYPTHLDYHGSFENYRDAKLQITKNQTAADTFVVNADQPEILAVEESVSKATITTFSMLNDHADYYLASDGLHTEDGSVFELADIMLPGQHNLQNILVAMAISKTLGVADAAITQVLKTFSGVKHRLQFVQDLNGRKVYNDSKSTNEKATSVALQSFHQPEVLIAGGLDRGFNFDGLIPLFKEHVKAIVTYGETKELLAASAQKAGVPSITVVDDLAAAVPVAYQNSAVGDIILFSPACASWDQFDNFEQRGDFFIEYIKQIEVDNK